MVDNYSADQRRASFPACKRGENLVAERWHERLRKLEMGQDTSEWQEHVSLPAVSSWKPRTRGVDHIAET